MAVQSLYLHNFRCYEQGYFEFCPHLNLISGPNARGKTSILEALHLLMIGRSFRTIQNNDLIKNQADGYFIEASFIKHDIEQTLRIVNSTSERKIYLNGNPLGSVSNLLGLIPGVLQTPDDVNLIKGSPQLRRQFLDIQIAQIDPLYVHHLSRYNRAMRQRNQLLKAKSITSIEVWEYEMYQSASYIISKRNQTMINLQKHCQNFYAELTGEVAELTIKYRTSPPNLTTSELIKEYFQKQYQKNREREKILGYTLIGPHKDDFNLFINNLDVRFFASEGQQRSCATALHFSEWLNLKQIGHEKPLFLFDDVGMSLDKNRSERLLLQLHKLGQVFLTTTDESLFQYYPGDKKAFSI